MSLDPIVQRFTPFSGPVAEGRQVDCLGVMFEDRLFDPDAELKPAREVSTDLLAFSGEAYFDWLEMLRAVDAAKDTFTMIWAPAMATGCRRERRPPASGG